METISGSFPPPETRVWPTGSNRHLGQAIGSFRAVPATLRGSATTAISYRATTAAQVWLSRCLRQMAFPTAGPWVLRPIMGKGLTVQVNSTAGGHIVWPGSG